MKDHRAKHFTIKNIKSYLDSEYENLPSISEWSIRKLLKHKFRYSYKKQGLIQKKMLTFDNIRKFYESAAMQILLELIDYELIYVDEFTLNFRFNTMYGWSPIGKWSLLESNINKISMSFMIGFSSNRVYGILGTTGTHNSDSFIVFVRSAVEYRTQILENSNSNFMIVCDNSSIHKSMDVSRYISGTCLRILTICPYSPSLNPVEKLILYIKKKLNSLHSKNM